MRGARQPLGHADDLFEAGFLRSNCKSDRSLNHVRIEWRTIIGALDVPQGVEDALSIAHVGDNDLGPLRLQPRAAAILPVHHRADGIAGLQQFGNNDAACLPGRAGHNDPRLSHDRLLLRAGPPTPEPISRTDMSAVIPAHLASPWSPPAR